MTAIQVMDDGVIRDATSEEIAEIEARRAATPTVEEVVSAYMADVQVFMDQTAVSFGYDSLLSVVSYADETAVPRYQAEGQAFRAWRSQVWACCEQVKADVDAGKRSAPSSDQLIAELPPLAIQSSMPT